MRIQYDKHEINEMLEPTLLKPHVTEMELDELCALAQRHNLPTVVVNPVQVKKCVARLKESKVAVATVIGFPLGETYLPVKLLEIKLALKNGAREFDAVAPLSLIKQGNWKQVNTEVAKMVKAVKGRVFKLIIETCYLTEQEIVRCCEICVANKVHFVKTSTGFGTRGATLEDIDLMVKAIKSAPRNYDPALFTVNIKASGGIKTYAQAKTLAEAGAKRIGTSNAAEIVVDLDASEAQPEPVQPQPQPEPATETVKPKPAEPAPTQPKQDFKNFELDLDVDQGEDSEEEVVVVGVEKIPQ